MYDFFAITFSQDNLDDDNAKVISALLNNVNREFGKLGFPKKITVFRGGNIGSKNKFLFVCAERSQFAAKIVDIAHGGVSWLGW